MKKAILLLLPLALAAGCSDDGKSGTHAAGTSKTGTASGTTGSGTTTANKPTTTPAPKTTPSNANAPKAPDNTAINERDRDGKTLTPPDQQENETDLALTQKIRQAIIDDDNLSMSADNVKIISQNGKVTLRGPVKDQAEKANIEAKAKAVAGVTSVDNQLEVKGS